MPDDRPHALIAEQQRVRGSRAATARALTRRRFRRRVLPPLAVTSAVLLGTGGASAWVYGAIEHKASTPTGSNASDQLSTLEQLRAQLAADQRALASIAGAAPAGSVAAATSPSVDGATSAGQPPGTTPPNGQPAPTRSGIGTSKTTGTVNTGGPAGTAVTTHAPAAGQTQPAAGQPQPPAAQPTANPGAPTPAPVPTAPAPAPKPTPPPPAPTPTVHATSGASGG
jgi:hypothetical protein